MAIKLEDKPNTTAPDVVNYPYGDIRDNPGDNSGTPVNRIVYADFHQFFAKLMDAGGVVYNGLLENLANSFQYFTALVNVIKSTIAGDVTVMGVDGSVKLKRKIVAIGDWNMDSTATLTVAHGVSDFTKIRSVEVYIRDDDNTNIYPIGTGFNLSNPVTVPQGAIQSISSSLVFLARLTSGLFDGTNFNSTSYNRGWIHIIYEA